MVCSKERFLNCKLAKDCACYKAVMRTYKTMCDDQAICDDVAREAAQRVYAFHRPSEDICAAEVTLERWINEGHIQ